MTDWAWGWCLAFAVWWSIDFARATVKSLTTKDSWPVRVSAMLITPVFGGVCGFAFGWLAYAFARGVVEMLR